MEDTLQYDSVVPQFTPDPAQRKISRKELGELRHRHFTVRNVLVTACQHKLAAQCTPLRNCEDCWRAYFEVYADLPALHLLLTEGGESAMISKYGSKFTKRFKQFLIVKLSQIGEKNEPVASVPTSSQEL